MSLMDLQLKNTLLEILESDEALHKVNFSFDRFTVGTMHFRQLAAWIKAGRLRCKVNPAEVPSGAEAAYDQARNTIFAKFSQVRYDSDRQVLVHEATHAYLDLLGGVHRKFGLTILEDETCAFLAGAMYALAHSEARKHRSGVRVTVTGGSSKKNIFREANLLVRKKGLGSGATNAGAPVLFLKADVAALQTQIKAHALYQNWPQRSAVDGL